MCLAIVHSDGSQDAVFKVACRRADRRDRGGGTIDRRMARPGPQERATASGTCVIPEARVAVKFLVAGCSMSFLGLTQSVRGCYQEEANAH